MKFIKLKNFSTAQIIALNFLVVILIGSILLYLPITHQKNVQISYIDALFVATSATCVTGLTPVVIDTTFNAVGKIVILILIQIGGLGLMTIMSSFVLFLKNRISLKERQTLSEMLNRSDLFNFKAFIKKVIKFTILFEGIGAILLFTVFIQKTDLVNAIGQAIFTSISAFCNAGFDLLGSKSLIPFKNNYFFLSVVMILIVFGGLGFVVWSDIVDFYKQLKQKKPISVLIRSISTHTKVVAVATLALIFIPAIITGILEHRLFHNSSVTEIIFNTLFQSITLRTAGFYTMDFSLFRHITLLFMIPIMFIGGSSGGTAGGVKTTTFFIAVAYLIAVIKGQKDVIIFKRMISKEIVTKAFTLIFINILVLFIGIFLVSLEIADSQIIPYAFEAASALATVGISTGITSTVSMFGKIVLIALMYIGRIGIVTLVFSMRGTQSKNNTNVGYPTGNMIVG